MNEKKRPYRISSDPYAGEVMNIQREDDGTFYVEIPELEWRGYDYKTAYDALDAAMEHINTHASPSKWGRMAILAEKAALQDRITALENEIKLIDDAVIRHKAKSRSMSEELRELPEDIDRLRNSMRFLEPGSPFPAKAVGFKLWKDYDGDGDMDYAFILWSGHKKLVGGKDE